MNVVILCGGKGTRLKEETEYKPKPMVKIGDRPMLWHIMSLYAHYGYKDFILCLGYKGEMLKEYFLNYEMLNSDFTVHLGRRKAVGMRTAVKEDWRVTLVDTGEETLKGARLKKIEPYVKGKAFMVTYGDGIADVDIKKLVQFHKKHGKIGTVTGVRPPSRFGELKVEGRKVKLFREKSQISTGLINGGFFVFDRKIFNYLAEDEQCDLERGPLEQMASEGQLMVYEHKGLWECMDTARDVEHLNSLWHAQRAFWKVKK